MGQAPDVGEPVVVQAQRRHESGSGDCARASELRASEETEVDATVGRRLVELAARVALGVQLQAALERPEDAVARRALGGESATEG